MTSDKEIVAAAKILKEANKVLFLTGSGMSADSGIPTFKEERISRNFSPEKRDNGKYFKENPAECWKLYEAKRRTAGQREPHEGYSIINKLAENFDAFVITTNIDGYHLKSGFPAGKILESHGSLWRLQYLNGLENYVEENYQVPLCKIDESGNVEESSIPRNNGEILRPNVFMHNDSYYIENNSQIQNWHEFQEDGIAVVLLIGSGNQMPKNINRARLLQGKGSKVICLNPFPDECYPILIPDISIRNSAKKGLVELGKILID